MADDLKDLRDQFQSDLDDWSETRTARGKGMRALAGDPWEPDERTVREDAGRPCLTTDELSQYVNQIVNEVRANPRAVQFAPTGVGTSEDVADFYANKMREIEYRSHAQLAYSTAFESAVMGGYGFVRVTSEYQPDSVDQQELVIKPVMDPNTVIPNWNFQRPDLSDMRRCFVLEHRPIPEFKRDFPKAKVTDFGSYLADKEYSNWIGEDRILLAEHWEVRQTQTKLLLVQPPTVTPPSGSFGFRPPMAPPPITIRQDDWAKQPQGTTFLRERETTIPKVIQQLVNGVEILSETTWPGPYIPIAGCMGRVLYLDDGTGGSKRVIMSAIQLALEPFMAYCFYRTCEIENVGMTTKNPYWAYEGQIDPTQATEIAKSLHEPVAVLFAKAVTEATGQTVLPLPQRNISEPAIQALSVGAEEMRRAIQAAMATNFLPTQAQRSNEKSGKALEKIDQARQKGSFHFVDHFEMMLRQVGCICEAAMPEIYDTARQVLVRKADDSTEQIWVNNPSQQGSMDLKGSYAVTVSSGPSVDSTREAASEFADMLLSSEALMTLLGPQAAKQIAALAVKLKVKETGIGAIGEQIVDIISPPADKELSPEQLQAQNQQLQTQLQQMQQMLQQAAQERESGLAKEHAKTERDVFLTKMEQQFDAFLQKLKGDQALQLQALKDAGAIRKQDDAQRHELGLTSVEQAHTDQQLDRQQLASVAQMGAIGSGKDASA